LIPLAVGCVRTSSFGLFLLETLEVVVSLLLGGRDHGVVEVILIVFIELRPGSVDVDWGLSCPVLCRLDWLYNVQL
jgi:hypothetical protein